MVIAGVLSDTHISKPDTSLKDLFSKKGIFKDIDIVIHAGDFTSMEVLEFLNSNFDFYGVQGNMDDYDVKNSLPVRRIIEIEDVRIGLTHGWGSPHNLVNRVYEYFKDPSLDCIIFGHSHIKNNSLIGKTLMFNPGSFKSGFFSPNRTVGKLLIKGGVIKHEIIKL